MYNDLSVAYAKMAAKFGLASRAVSERPSRGKRRSPMMSPPRWSIGASLPELSDRQAVQALKWIARPNSIIYLVGFYCLVSVTLNEITCRCPTSAAGAHMILGSTICQSIYERPDERIEMRRLQIGVRRDHVKIHARAGARARVLIGDNDVLRLANPFNLVSLRAIQLLLRRKRALGSDGLGALRVAKSRAAIHPGSMDRSLRQTAPVALASTRCSTAASHV